MSPYHCEDFEEFARQLCGDCSCADGEDSDWESEPPPALLLFSLDF